MYSHVCMCSVCLLYHLVVQLFNAVSKHKKSLEEKLKEAGPSERKKRKGNQSSYAYTQGITLITVCGVYRLLFAYRAYIDFWRLYSKLDQE